MGLLSLIKPLAYLSLPVLLLRTLSQASPIARYYVRLSVYISALGLCSAWGAIISVPMTLAGRRFDINWVVARTFYLLAGKSLGITIEVEGEEHLHTCPGIFVGNHQSMLDVLYLGRVLQKRMSIMAKKELQRMPILGQFMSLSGAVFVDRGNSTAALRSLTAAAETIRERRISLWMFPEGTRTMLPYHDMKPFKKGAFHMAVEAGVPIVPVVCENYWTLYRKDVFEEGKLKIKVLPPVSTKGLTSDDVGALSVRVREMMVEALREISFPVSEKDIPTSAKMSAEPSTERTAKTPTPGPASSKNVAEPAPLAAIPTLTEAGPDTIPSSIPDSRSESRASTNLSDDFSSPPSTSSHSREEGSETGVETEEDEGMVLVGRPSQP